MSEENVEVVQRVLSDFGDAQQIQGDLFASDWVFDVSAFEGWPGQQEFTGIEEFREFFASWTEPYTEWVQEIGQIRDAGPNHVVATMHQRGRLRSSGSWVELHYGLLYTLRQGQIQFTRLYTPPEKALEAAGLAE